MKNYLLSILALLSMSAGALAQSNERSGWWKFDDSTDVLAPTIGYALEVEGTASFIQGPADNNNAVRIKKGDYLILDHGISPNGGSDSLVNEYSILIDFSMPVAAMWHAIFQSSDNSDDAELFINTENHIGAWRFGYSTNVIEEGVWYRMVVSVKNGSFYKLYINGELWVDGAGQEVDSRDGLAETMLIFADNDGEDGDMDISELSIWDVALSDDEVAELGDVNTVRVGISSVLNKGGNQDIQQIVSNSSKGISTFNYWVNESGPVEFTLFDSNGRCIQQVHEGMKFAGKNQFKLGTNQLKNGIYLLQMRSNIQLISQSVLIRN